MCHIFFLFPVVTHLFVLKYCVLLFVIKKILFVIKIFSKMSHDKPDGGGLRRHSKFGTVNCRPKGWKNYVEGMPPVHSYLNIKYFIPVTVC